VIALKFVRTLALAGALLAGSWAVPMAQAQQTETSKAVQAFQLTDDRGRVVVIDKAPQRVVTLLPSLGEIVCELKA